LAPLLTLVRRKKREAWEGRKRTTPAQGSSNYIHPLAAREEEKRAEKKKKRERENPSMNSLLFSDAAGTRPSKGGGGRGYLQKKEKGKEREMDAGSFSIVTNGTCTRKRKRDEKKRKKGRKGGKYRGWKVS